MNDKEIRSEAKKCDKKNQRSEIEVIKLELSYVADPIRLYSTLCQDKPYTLLLESADIHSKKNLKSLMLIDAAVRVVCRGNQVELHALTDNGEFLLTAVIQRIQSLALECVQWSLSSRCLSLSFQTTQQDLDEDSRLHQISSFDGLRLIQQSFDTADLPNDTLFIGGLFAYDLVDQFEPLPKVKTTNQCPDYVFYVSETLLVVDHDEQKSYLQATRFASDGSGQLLTELNDRLQLLKDISLQEQPLDHVPSAMACPVTESIDDLAFKNIVHSLKQYVIQGDVFQVVPSRQFILPCVSSLSAYAYLKQSNPSPYMFYMQDSDFTLFGASPESALKYTKETNQVEIYPIAGTRPRGKNADGSINFDLDGRIELALRSDQKENAEHMMLVDLARNDVARISQAGTRYVADLLKVDRYSHVMHLVSRVVGLLRDDLDALHAYQACMNMGTLTGAPKIRAMQLIRDVEQQRRASYGGAVGYLNGHGDMDTCIVIRSAYVENEIAYVQAGAGVVFDSDPQAEADETRAKAQAVITAIQMAHQGDHV